MLYGIISRFLIDVYPSERHYGFGMGGRRPIEVYNEIMETRGSVPLIDAHLRRIHLGWQEEVTFTDEGVRVFSGIWFNSDALQEHEAWHRQKVQVFVDPDDLNFATVLVPGARTPVEVALQATVFADLSLPEALEVMAAWRREHPEVTDVYQDRLMRHRRELFESQRKIGIEHKLPRSYSTIEECRRRARAVFAGARIVPVADRARTVAPDSLADLSPDVLALEIGSGGGLIDGTAEDITPDGATFEPGALVPPSSTGSEPDEAGGASSPAVSPAPAPMSKPSTDPLPKPTVRKLQ